MPFEELDAGGRLKASSVDARSTLPDGTEVRGVNDLKRYLSQDRIDQVAFSVLKHLATYANGRSLSYNELNYLKQDGAKLRPDGYRDAGHDPVCRQQQAFPREVEASKR